MAIYMCSGNGYEISRWWESEAVSLPMNILRVDEYVYSDTAVGWMEIKRRAV